ncbi:hypothetical protein JZ751_008852 [Albula glossodonta]|uniref:EF-hand domain-containing protein n=1 Tax=Albula glossodonta TaxID=121402 RepID=A0A8T2P840_9TELE|nr:hypothetical protein JZ751_008852 [Albula glossodonta]
MGYGLDHGKKSLRFRREGTPLPSQWSEPPPSEKLLGLYKGMLAEGVGEGLRSLWGFLDTDKNGNIRVLEVLVAVLVQTGRASWSVQEPETRQGQLNPFRHLSRVHLAAASKASTRTERAP